MFKTQRVRWLLFCATMLLLLGGVGLGMNHSLSKARAAADVLILSTTVTNGDHSFEAQAARALGLTVNIVDPATWDAMATVDFASYKAIILGDPECSNTNTTPIDPAAANNAVWGPAITGNIAIVGSDPSYHARFGIPSAIKLIRDSISFATSTPGHTGAYISLSCYYVNAASNTPVPLLDAFGPEGFTVEGEGPCPNNAHVIFVPPAFRGLKDADLDNWNCSIHEQFDTFPSTFQPLAINQVNQLAYVLLFTPLTASTGSQPQLIFPFSKPTASDPEQWTVTQGFNTGNHEGYDRFAFDLQHTDTSGNGCDSCTAKQPVLAAASGVVVFAENSTGCIAIRHNAFVDVNGVSRWYFTIYCHLLTPFSVTAGQSVIQGQQIGLAWNTHTSQTCADPCPYHIQFALFSALDPLAKVNRRAEQPLKLLGYVVRDNLNYGGYLQNSWPWDGVAVNAYGNPAWIIQASPTLTFSSRQVHHPHTIRHPRTPNVR